MTAPDGDLNHNVDSHVDADGRPTGPLRPDHTVRWALLFALLLAALGYGYYASRARGVQIGPTTDQSGGGVGSGVAAPTAPPTPSAPVTSGTTTTP